MLIYVDTVILIYYYDHTGTFNTRATNRLNALTAGGDQIATSDLVRLEYHVKPLRIGDHTGLAIFDAFFARPDVRVVPITTAVFDRATLIRATHNFKLGDSIHLAAAVLGGCDRFLTNDGRLRRSRILRSKCCHEIEAGDGWHQRQNKSLASRFGQFSPICPSVEISRSPTNSDGC
jgi:predicted nucleic acid-binding protein